MDALGDEGNDKELEGHLDCLEEAIRLSKRVHFTEQEYTDLVKNNPEAKTTLDCLLQKRNGDIYIDLDEIDSLAKPERKALGVLFRRIEDKAEVSLDKIYSEIKRLDDLEPRDAHYLCVIAELMKRVGDYFMLSGIIK